MMAGEQTCASCASYVQELSVAAERYDALSAAMKQMENDTLVSKTLADQRELQMFSNKAELEASMLSLQGAFEIQKIDALQLEQDAQDARSELEQATENNFCFDSVHKVLQEDLDSAQLEIVETRTNERTLEEKITTLKEQVAEMQNRSASTLGRAIAQGRKESSRTHPTLAALLEEETQGADGEYKDMITGSELVIAGGVLEKEGNGRFTCFGNANDYHELVNAEEYSKTEKIPKHNGLSMDTGVPKMLKQAMIISS